MAQPDDYEVLGVPRDADDRTIKDAFRKLALRYRPDHNKEPGAAEWFKAIAAAYAVLSDPDKRAAHDRGGLAGIPAGDPFAGINLEDIFAGFGFDVGGGRLNPCSRAGVQVPSAARTSRRFSRFRSNASLRVGRRRFASPGQKRVSHATGRAPGLEPSRAGATAARAAAVSPHAALSTG